MAEVVRGTSPDGGRRALAGRQGSVIPAGRKVARQDLRVAEEAAERTDKFLRRTEKATHEAELRTAVFGALKTADYYALTVDEISKRIAGLSSDQLKQVREFEKNHKNREILVAQSGRKIRANS